MSSLVIRRPSSSYRKVGFACLVMLATSAVLLVMDPTRYPRPLTQALGVMGLLVTLACAAWWAKQWGRRHDPVLVIDEQGFEDHSSAVAVGRVPWSDVTGLRLVDVGGKPTVCIDVVEPEVHLARLGAVAAGAARVNTSLVGTPICFTASGLDRPAPEIVEAMQTSLAQSRTPHL